MTIYSEKKLSGDVIMHIFKDEEVAYPEAIYTHPIPNGMFLAIRDHDGKAEGIGKTRRDAVIDLIENVSGFDARFIYNLDALK